MSEADLTPSDFTAFFRALWGFDPFPWQEALLIRLATRESYPHLWPDVLDLPTGSGKTATLDIATFHLALEATKGADRRAPLRIAFVVDRRLVVDDAYERARHIARALRWSLLDDREAMKLETKLDLSPLIRRVRAEPVVRSVAIRLRGIAGPCQPPLIARALRGGAPLEHDWARTPVQPAILCSTVDQVGSRILFRGYGVTSSMKPVHAGLLGSDCLILLDEAHLSEPFRQTLAAIEELRAPDKAPFDFAMLTATPAKKQAVQFNLSEADRAHPLLSRRLNAEKPARLVEIAGKQGVDTESRRADVAAEHARLVTERLRASGIACPAVGVVLNRISRARMVFERLDAELKDAADLVLLIGPARAVDRDRHASRLDVIRTREFDAPRRLNKPLIVVATQTIEVGIDIDFDGLVTEAASLDALRQRFGRLNRAGRVFSPQAVILAHKEDLAAKANDVIYGDRIKKTWEAMIRWGASAPVDFGTRPMEAIVNTETGPLIDLVAEPLDAPVLMPAYANLLSQTSPIPNADPDIALFLHGHDRSSARVQIVWRGDIEIGELYSAWRNEDERERLVDLFTLMPPRAGEAVEVPLWAARAWLEEPGIEQAEFSDGVDAEHGPEHGQSAEQRRGRPAFRWVGKGHKRSGDEKKRSKVVTPSELQNGDLIIVPGRYGGCDEWGWKPASDVPVIDVGDAASLAYRSRSVAVRVTPDLIAQGLCVEGKDVSLNIAERLTATLAAAKDQSETLLEAVKGLEFLPDSLAWLLASLDRRKGRFHQLQHEFAYGFDPSRRPRGIVFLAPFGLNATDEEELAAIPSTESDELGAISDGPVPLRRHSQDVHEWADGFADRAGLMSQLRADVALSAYLHDLGKAEPRYQAYYAGGSPYGPDACEVLAKSGRARLPHGSWERASLPSNWRHEALSVRLALIHPEFEQAQDPELVLWLVGTHHGYGRPLFPHSDSRNADCCSNLLKALGISSDLPSGPGPQSLAFTFNHLDWAQIFERLKCRYGIWGLARLEAFVRLSDHRASEHGSPPKVADPIPCKDAAE